VPLDATTRHTLRKLFDERGLMVFRDFHVDLAFQTYLSRMLVGEEPQSTGTGAAAPPIEYYVSNKEADAGVPFGRLLFHSDLMWREDAFQLLSLYGVKVDQPAVPTMFASAKHAWDTLSEELRARVHGRFAVHSQDATYQRRAVGSDVVVSTFKAEETVKLPVGYRHRRTGKTLLYVCQQMTHGIADLAHEESEELLEALFEHLYAPGNIVEHHWREGDLVLWDNLALQHARPNVTSEGPTRTLRKVFAPMVQMQRTDKPQLSLAGS
jgi:taurine dioxygenase